MMPRLREVVGKAWKMGVKAQARRLRQEAESQLSLLCDIQNIAQSDFYSYRYFASEGFLPGYNFPRLPLMAYIPATSDGRGRQAYLQRPRFLALSEFGPRSLVYHEKVDGVRVVRTWLWPLPNRKAHERIRNYVSFCMSSAISGLELEKPDIVIATSPQLLVALSGWWLAWWKRVPFVFEVRDLWPESLAAVGAGGLLIASFFFRNKNTGGAKQTTV